MNFENYFIKPSPQSLPSPLPAAPAPSETIENLRRPSGTAPGCVCTDHERHSQSSLAPKPPPPLLPPLAGGDAPARGARKPGEPAITFADLGRPRGGFVRRGWGAQSRRRAASPRKNIEISTKSTKNHPKAQKCLISQNLKTDFSCV